PPGTTSVPIHSDAPPEVSKTAGLPGQGPDARIERRGIQVGRVVLQTIAEEEGRLAEGGIAEINRVETEPQRGRTACDIQPMTQLAVADAPPGAHHCLVIQFVSAG